jgi:hypothetical protein
MAAPLLLVLLEPQADREMRLEALYQARQIVLYLTIHRMPPPSCSSKLGLGLIYYIMVRLQISELQELLRSTLEVRYNSNLLLRMLSVCSSCPSVLHCHKAIPSRAKVDNNPSLM